jgi:hypothetical protein
LHVQEVGRTQASVPPLDELSPGMHLGECGGLQVTVHFAQGGGPWTLHDDGLVISHRGVGAGEALFGTLVGAAIAKLGVSSSGISSSMRKVIWST